MLLKSDISLQRKNLVDSMARWIVQVIQYIGHSPKVMDMQGSVSIDTYTITLTYSAMPTTPIYLFACCEEGQAVNKASFRCRGFSIHNDNGDVMRLLPYKRDSDGVIGMLDEVSRRFYTNDGEGEFIAGSTMVLPDGYTFIEEVSFNADTLYDMGIITSEDSIDIQYKREDTSSSQYLYGITNSNNTASVTAYLASNGAWRFGNQLVRPNTANKKTYTTQLFLMDMLYMMALQWC